MKNKLQPSTYQLVPLIKLINNKLNCVHITDDVGLGKTISAGYILLYSYYKFQQPPIVICPPNLVNKWAFELSDKFNFSSHTIESHEAFKQIDYIFDNHNFNLKKPSVYIIKPSLLTTGNLDINPSCIIFDEIHNYRNSDTILFKKIYNFSKISKLHVGLTATPINNSFEDLINEFKILLPFFPPDHIQYMLLSSWSSDNQPLHSMITNFKKYRLNKYFITRDITSIPINYSDDYINMCNKLISKHQPKEDFFSRMQLYRLASSSKSALFKSFKVPLKSNKLEDIKIKKLNNLLKNITPNQVIIFCAFKETANDLANKISIPDKFIINGDTPFYKRSSIINEFKAKQNSALILTEVGSEGIDLQFCHILINYDLHWNPMKIEQRIGRIDRRGQNKSNVQIFNFQVLGSIDDHIINVLERKLKLISTTGFELSHIFGPTRKSINKKIKLFGESSLLHKEIDNTSGKFIESFKKINELPHRDYDILKSVNQDYCNPDFLKTAIINNKLQSNSLIKNSSNKWLKDIITNSDYLYDFLKSF
jgi:superfamily II DNA or RNA helicase